MGVCGQTDQLLLVKLPRSGFLHEYGCCKDRDSARSGDPQRSREAMAIGDGSGDRWRKSSAQPHLLPLLFVAKSLVSSFLHAIAPGFAFGVTVTCDLPCEFGLGDLLPFKFWQFWHLWQLWQSPRSHTLFNPAKPEAGLWPVAYLFISSCAI